MPDTFIGVDPGLNGAIAVLDKDGLRVFDMPVARSEKSGRRELDIPGLARLFNEVCFLRDTFCVVEQQQAMTKQGVVSMFTLGVGYGAILAMAHSTCRQTMVVRPQTWKAAFAQYGVSADKAASVDCAERLFEDSSTFRGARGGAKDGRAEAALIAKWASWFDTGRVSREHELDDGYTEGIG